MKKLTNKDIGTLKAIAEHRLLLIDQVAYLNYTGRRAAQKKVVALHKAGYLDLISRSLGKGKGRPENLCSLSEKGVDVLRSMELIDPAIPYNRITGQEIRNKNHDLLVNWFRLHILQLQRSISDLSTDFISSTTPFLPLRPNGQPTISETINIQGQEQNFVPDAVFSIYSEAQVKRLLFFLEVDMSTESITSLKIRTDTINQKINNYKAYFLCNGYKRYENKWEEKLQGFRLLFLTDSNSRKGTISRHIFGKPEYNFVWITDQDSMFQHGLGENIWAKGGDTISSQESIIGPTLACNTPLPLLK